MLELKNIAKSYTTGNFTQKALDDVSLSFRQNEFVSILGPSGSGKTTLLNIIGGLDQYDSGDLLIDGQSTKDYSNRDWDTYRNYSIGFVFQSYNLIPHQSVLNNVILALKLGGLSKSEQKTKATKALEEVGLGDHIHKKPNQLSGGQMQRVAIARALVNDPEIILADEPTGALDSKTSTAIMDLLQQVAKDRLVIMVTHDPELAHNYSTRIVQLHDGVITADSDPYEIKQHLAGNPPKKQSGMSFLTALGLSFNNLWDKKARTLLTAFAGSIGIIGIALILALTNGVSQYITDVQEDTLASYPLTINSEEMDISSFVNMGESFSKEFEEEANKGFSDVRISTMGLEAEQQFNAGLQENDLKSFKSFLEKDNGIQEAIGKNGVNYTYPLKFKAFTEDEDNQWIDTDTVMDDDKQSNQFSFDFTNQDENGKYFNQLTSSSDAVISPMIKDTYDLVDGQWPSQANQVVLILLPDNSLLPEDAVSIGLMTKSEYDDLTSTIDSGDEVKGPRYSSDEVIGHKYYLYPEAMNYTKQSNQTFEREDELPNKDKIKSDGIELEISGIIAPKETDSAGPVRGPIAYTSDLTDEFKQVTNNSPVVKQQSENVDTNVLTGLPFEAKDDNEKAEQGKDYLENLTDTEKVMAYFKYVGDNEEANHTANDSANAMDLSMLQADDEEDDVKNSPLIGLFDEWVDNQASKDDFIQVYHDELADYNYEDNMKNFGAIHDDQPESIDIYTDSFDQKDQLSDAIERYNDEAKDGKEITYTDFVGLLTTSIASIINVIAYVLIGFVSISLIVSAIMIGIITYISVQERTKEIGVLRALGASKRNTTTMFVAENLLIGITSGAVGVGISYLVIFTANYVIHHVFNHPEISAYLGWKAVIALIVLATIITVIGGLYPARSAAKKDPVTALRTE